MRRIAPAVARLSARERRTILVGAMALLLAIAWVFGLAPAFASLARSRAALELEQAAYRKEHALLAGRDDVRAAWDATLRALSADSGQFFQWRDETGGRTSGVINLENFVQDAALETGIWIDNMVTTTDSTISMDVVTPARVKLAARGSTDAAAHFVSALEGADRLLRLERLRIFALPDGVAPGQLGFEVHIIGFLLSSGAVDGITAS